MSEKDTEADLPDPMELFERMRQKSEEASTQEEEEELPDPAALFREMEEARQSQLELEVEALPDPVELFQKMQELSGPVKDDIHLPMPGDPPEQTLEPEPKAQGLIQRIKAKFRKEPRFIDEPVDFLEEDLWGETPLSLQKTPELLPSPAELFERYQEETSEPSLDFGLEETPVSEIPLPSPEEMFRQLQEERAASPELPQLPDLEAFKKELEEEERARLDPDLMGELSGPERFVNTVSDSIFEASTLPGFRRAPPPIPEPYEEPEPKLEPELDFGFDSIPEAEAITETETETNPVPSLKPDSRQVTPIASDPTPSSNIGPTGTRRVNYQATQETGQKTPPRYPAGPSPAAAKRQIAKAPLKAEPPKEPKRIKPRRFSRVKLAIFTRQMAVMVHAGIQLHMAISFAAESDPEMNPLLTGMMRKVEAGYTYSAAISEASRTFDPIYVGLVQAGELSGRLPQMLSRLADVLEREVELRKRLVSVITYPIVLLSICLLGTLGFVYFVLPTLTPLFDDLGVNLPLPTRILLASRDFILPVLGATFATVFGLYLSWDKISDFVRSKPSLERGLAAIPFRIPVLGEVYDKLVTARVLYSLSTMLDVGITLGQALARSELTAGNALIAYRLSKARMDLEEGVAVTDCFRRNDLFNPSALHLISAGEESAKLVEMFAFIARLFDEEVEYALETASAVLEPMIMVCMGIIVGFITISAALPTIQILQNFS